MQATLIKDWNWKEDLKQLKNILRDLFPKGKSEIILFFIFFISYGILAVFFATQTNITDQVKGKVDAYFSFDGAYMSHHGASNFEGHPLINIITYTFIYIGILLNIILGTIKAKATFLVIICAFCISSSNIFIFRYLNKVIEIKESIAYLICFFYSVFTTPLFLSFTFESFTFSIYILTFIIYYYSYNIKNKNNISFTVSIILAITAGGITITNFSKGIIPILFLNENKKTIIKKIFVIGIFFAVILLLIEIKFHIFSAIEGRLDLFIIKEKTIHKYVIDMFLGAPILLPSLTTYFPHNTDFEAINIDFYKYWWQYATIGLIGLIVLLSIVKNYKNKLIYIPILFFSIDIVIHIIIRYGINEGIIYGGHWVFIVPILIGWLYKSLNGKNRKYLSALIIVLGIILAVNNIYQMNQFISLAYQLFPI